MGNVWDRSFDFDFGTKQEIVHFSHDRSLADVLRRAANDGQLDLTQLPSFPGRQLVQDFPAFAQAQPLQESVAPTTLTHTILSYATRKL